jgi:DNA replication protein DnaC
VVVDICHRGLPSSWLHPWLADSGFHGAGGLPGRAPRGTPCGNAGTGRLLPEAFEFLRLGGLTRPHRVNPAFQHARLMAQIAQLRLQRLDLEIQNLFRLNFIEEQANVIFLGGVGLGKTHLSIALGHTACLRGHSVLFATAVDIINSLNAAYVHGGLKRELRRYVKPRVLIVDELGYLPVDKQGADALFQIISQRYEHGPTIISSNRAFKHWAEIFNHDSTLTSALLDRLLHHAETVVIEGKSYRMKDQESTDPATL